MHCMILWSVERVTEETPCENKYELFQNVQKKLCNTFRNLLTPTLNFHNTSTKAPMVVVLDHLPHSASPSSDSWRLIKHQISPWSIMFDPVFFFLTFDYLQSSLYKGKAAGNLWNCSSSVSDGKAVVFHWLLRIVFIVMPGCHPGFLFQVFPVGISRIHRPLLPFDPNCIVTGNLIFIFGTFKKATLQRKEGKQNSVFGLRTRPFKDVQRKPSGLRCLSSVSFTGAKMQLIP